MWVASCRVVSHVVRFEVAQSLLLFLFWHWMRAGQVKVDAPRQSRDDMCLRASAVCDRVRSERK